MEINEHLSLIQMNEIPVVVMKHTTGEAKIALQGAQLLSWQPAGAAQDVFWLSEIEPFKAGQAIRGGIPICYPWFGPRFQPSHGTARLRLWQLSDYQIDTDKVMLEFSLFDEQGIIEAKVRMRFAETCQITFTHYGQDSAQAALHSYFRVADITHTEVQNLPEQCFNQLTGRVQNVPSPRIIDREVDCIYHLEQADSQIVDQRWQRKITISHQQAGEIVLWNPWQKPTSSMSEEGHKSMLCVETARLSRPLQFGESIGVEIALNTL